MAPRFRPPADWLDRSAWLFVLLVLLMLLPAAFVLWFMNEAIATRTAEAEQSMREANRGQLRLVRARIDERWLNRTASLDRTGDAAAFFARQVVDERADGLVVMNPDGTPLFPSASGDDPDLVAGVRAQLRSRPVDVARVAALLNDYSTALSGFTRLALMEELRPHEPNVRMPTQAALRLSREWIQSGALAPEPGGLHETAIPGLWAMTARNRGAVALHWTGQLESAMHDFLHEVEPDGITFIPIPPGMPADAEAIAAGTTMPGWQVSFIPLEREDGSGPASEMTSRYLAIGLGGIALIAGLGATVGRGFFQQFRLARLKTDLVAAVSHELRTPIASVRVLVDGLLADPELDPVKTREYLTLMSAENARLQRLIENFLTFSRLERSRYRFDFAATPPAAVISAAIDAVRDRTPAGCDVEVDVEPGLPMIVADKEAITTALVNLLDNALKYTPEEKRIRVRACREGDRVAVTVADNGLGIPARERRRIFGRFYRIDRRLARDTAGVGLGLSIVDLIVRAHRGTVTVHSAPGAGAAFTLRLRRAGGTA